MVTLRFAGAAYDCAPDETVLDALLRQGAAVSYSCRKGTCLTCALRATGGPVPAAAQAGLGDTLVAQGGLLACQCRPTADLDLARPDDFVLYGRAVVTAVEKLSADIRRVRLRAATALYYHAGQFINLRRSDGLTRSYSLASVPALDRDLELHVQRTQGGTMTAWIFSLLEQGQAIDFQGPNGACFYLPGRPEQPLLLIGTGTGLAPLIGIVRDALNARHAGPIALYHGSRAPAGLYLHAPLGALAARHPNFCYHGCVSGGGADAPLPPGMRGGRADELAFADYPDLAGTRVFIAGHPAMVHAARREAYLNGASLKDILADPFELRELRGPARADQPQPRDVW